MHFNKVVPTLFVQASNLLPIFAIRANKTVQTDDAGVAIQFRDFADTTNILCAIFG